MPATAFEQVVVSPTPFTTEDFLSGTNQPGGLGSHAGGGDGPSVVVNASLPAAASSSLVTNQHILSVPNSVHENLSSASRKTLSIIEVEFALRVSEAASQAYSRILAELRQSSAPQ